VRPLQGGFNEWRRLQLPLTEDQYVQLRSATTGEA
jgi:3-mercaptopyruvate sulfurtransferase SseA